MMHVDSPAAIGERVAQFGDTFLAHKEGLIAVIEVYLDESGTHTDSQIIGVSAVWASKDVWRDWTLDWVQAKAPIRIHHSVDCHGRKGEWAGWSKPERDAYVLRILPVIRDHFIRGVVAAVDKREVARLLAKRHGYEIDSRLMVSGYYYVCLQWAIRTVMDDLSRAGENAIAFVHETNDYASYALEAFKQAERDHPELSATFGFGTKLAFPPLQCADVLAYEGNHQMRDFDKPLRKPLMAIDPTGRRFSFRKYAKAEVQPLVDFTAQYIERIWSSPGLMDTIRVVRGECHHAENEEPLPA